MGKRYKRKVIPPIQPVQAELKLLRFSFKHLDFNNPKFLPANCCPQYLLKLFETLHLFSNWTVDDFSDDKNNVHRHIIDFEISSEKNGFQHIYPQIDPEQFGSSEGWQFGVDPEDPGVRWRVHGVLTQDTYFVVWFDEEHRLFA
jgi:hypothetical protein